MNGKKRIPYAHVLYAAALTALLSACGQADCVREANSLTDDGTQAAATTHAAGGTDMPEVVITATREIPEVVIIASRDTPNVAG